MCDFLDRFDGSRQAYIPSALPSSLSLLPFPTAVQLQLKGEGLKVIAGELDLIVQQQLCKSVTVTKLKARKLDLRIDNYEEDDQLKVRGTSCQSRACAYPGVVALLSPAFEVGIAGAHIQVRAKRPGAWVTSRHTSRYTEPLWRADRSRVVGGWSMYSRDPRCCHPGYLLPWI